MKPSWIIGAFAVVTATNLVVVGLNNQTGVWVTKPLLMPLLAVLVYLTAYRQDSANLGLTTGRSLVPNNPVYRWLIIGLIFAWIADIALIIDSDTAFLIGVGVFGLMQLCYLTVFWCLGAMPSMGRRTGGLVFQAIPKSKTRLIGPVILYVFWLIFNVVMWPEFDALALPIALYSLLLVTMAAVAFGVSDRVATGAVLFVISDLMIGIRLAEISFPGQGIAIMATYTAAQLLIITGCLRARLSAGPVRKYRAGMKPDPRYL